MSSLLFARAGAAAPTTERARRLCILPSGPTPGCAGPLPRRPAGAFVFLDAGGRMTVVWDDGEDGRAQPGRSLRRPAAGDSTSPLQLSARTGVAAGRRPPARMPC